MGVNGFYSAHTDPCQTDSTCQHHPPTNSTNTNPPGLTPTLQLHVFNLTRYPCIEQRIVSPSNTTQPPPPPRKSNQKLPALALIVLRLAAAAAAEAALADPANSLARNRSRREKKVTGRQAALQRLKDAKEKGTKWKYEVKTATVHSLKFSTRNAKRF